MNTTLAVGHRLRIGRVSIPNQIYSITATTLNRLPIFTDLTSVRALTQSIKFQQNQGFATTQCFVVMPDHFHWLMQLGEERDLSQTVQMVKSQTSKILGKRVWQKGFYDRVIRKEEDIKAIARYIVANPLRAGLVTRIGDYPHWDCRWL